MGKPLGKHCSRQEEIHDLLVRKAAKAGRWFASRAAIRSCSGAAEKKPNILRSMEFLRSGSGSFFLPVSATERRNRSHAPRPGLVARHCHRPQRGRKRRSPDWCALSKVDTLVVLMGVHNAAHIAQHLMAAGRSPDTPVAAVQMAFWPGRALSLQLSVPLPMKCAAPMSKPGDIVIGEVVRLREKLKHHQQHIGEPTDQDSLVHIVSAPDLPRAMR